MSKFLLLILPGILLLPLYAEGEEAPKLPRNVLTNQGIVALAEAGYTEAFLVDLIRLKPTRFDTTAEGLAYLGQHGVSEVIVRAMLARENSHAQTGVTVRPVVQVQVVQRSGLFRHHWHVIQPTPPTPEVEAAVAHVAQPPW
jgi:hypothetical protein